MAQNVSLGLVSENGNGTQLLKKSKLQLFNSLHKHQHKCMELGPILETMYTYL